MTVLGIETSTAVCATGLSLEGRPAIERSLIESHIHSEKLLTLVQEVVSEAGISLTDVGAVAVSEGPGSFTGLRIGLSTAKGLCFTLRTPLVLVPTFEAIAEAARERYPDISGVVVAIDAKRDEFYVSKYAVTPTGVRLVEPLGILKADQVVRVAEGDSRTLVVTDSTERVSRGGGGSLVEHVHQFCRGSVVARVGRAKALKGESANLVSSEPLYLKDFVVRGSPVS
ncbi:MAG: tRNA (adenosine(37)-N6)-threonylcarbamoyltransferase complex dimerization subunit type 1 TsaB [Ignavibacteria bacterium]|nr:tRNA (adenosine(37)-N6)-threonylcarbamoyltransferase complex dimerization subunit type 1 TsaB [Ignavibacteria bacterium]